MFTEKHPDMVDSEIRSYSNLISNDIFDVTNKWPQFNLLIEDMEDLSTIYNKKGLNILSLERNMLYGGHLIWQPYFSRANFYALDLTPDVCKKRGAYNIDKVPLTIAKTKDNNALGKAYKSLADLPGDFDLIIIPNLVHHIEDQVHLWESVSSLLKSGGYLYVFEALLREIHQYPADYLRYTPEGLKEVISKHGFLVDDIKDIGSAFEATIYCYHQALEYLPEDIRCIYDQKLGELKKEFRALEGQYPTNKIRKNTFFPQAFSLKARIENE